MHHRYSTCVTCDDVLTSSVAATISSMDDDAAIAAFASLLDKLDFGLGRSSQLEEGLGELSD